MATATPGSNAAGRKRTRSALKRKLITIYGPDLATTGAPDTGGPSRCRGALGLAPVLLVYRPARPSCDDKGVRHGRCRTTWTQWTGTRDGQPAVKRSWNLIGRRQMVPLTCTYMR